LAILTRLLARALLPDAGSPQNPSPNTINANCRSKFSVLRPFLHREATREAVRLRRRLTATADTPSKKRDPSFCGTTAPAGLISHISLFRRPGLSSEADSGPCGGQSTGRTYFAYFAISQTPRWLFRPKGLRRLFVIIEQFVREDAVYFSVRWPPLRICEKSEISR
jgi:hypothetical protein